MGMTLVFIGIIGIVVGLIWILILNLKKKNLAKKSSTKKPQFQLLLKL